MYKIYVKGAKNCVVIMQLSSDLWSLHAPFVWFRNICPKVRRGAKKISVTAYNRNGYLLLLDRHLANPG